MVHGDWTQGPGGGSLLQGELSGSKDGNLAEYYCGVAVPVSGTLRGGRGAFVLFAMLLINLMNFLESSRICLGPKGNDYGNTDK